MAMAAPVIVATVLLVSGVLLLGRTQLLIDWGGRFEQGGVFQVQDCEPTGGLITRQWRCLGELTTDSGATVPSQLVTARQTITSSRPYVGQGVDVFFDDNNPSRVYATRSELAELTRLFFSLFPRLLLFLGSLAWLMGWLVLKRRNQGDGDLVVVQGSDSRTRRFLPVIDQLGRRRRLSPHRLQRRGRALMLAGVVSTALLMALTRFVVGSQGIT